MAVNGRKLSGPFLIEPLPGGVLRLRAAGAAAALITLRGVQPPVAALRCEAIEIEWHEDGAARARLLGASPAPAEVDLSARRALLHEARDGLYRQLPLASYDQRARRFWGRVFTLVRVPGGRRLLSLVARCARGRN